MARVFILSINYAPEPTGFAPHATALAEYLVRRGHDVRVFTGFPFAPKWRREEGKGQPLTATEQMAGVTVYRLSHLIPKRPSSAVQRALMEGTFCLTALGVLPWRAMQAGRPDVVLYIGAQPALAMLARLISRAFGCPYFVNVNDLAAESAAAVGIISQPWLRRLLESFEFAAYRGAAGASVLCGSFRDALIARGYPAGRIRLIRSPVDLQQVRPVARTAAFRRAHDIPDSAFVIMCAGSMGLKQGLNNVIEAAALVADPRLYWVLVGDGEVRAQLGDLVARRGLHDRVRFVPFQPVDEISQMFAAADLLLLNQISAVKDSVIPSKLLTYMAAGRPVLAAVNASSQGAEILNEANGGVIVPPEDPPALAGAALQLMAQPAEERERQGQRNRTYAEQYFDQHKIFLAHEQLMLAPVDRPIDAAPSVAG